MLAEVSSGHPIPDGEIYGPIRRESVTDRRHTLGIRHSQRRATSLAISSAPTYSTECGRGHVLRSDAACRRGVWRNAHGADDTDYWGNANCDLGAEHDVRLHGRPPGFCQSGPIRSSDASERAVSDDAEHGGCARYRGGATHRSAGRGFELVLAFDHWGRIGKTNPGGIVRYHPCCHGNDSRTRYQWQRWRVQPEYGAHVAVEGARPCDGRSRRRLDHSQRSEFHTLSARKRPFLWPGPDRPSDSPHFPASPVTL